MKGAKPYDVVIVHGFRLSQKRRTYRKNITQKAVKFLKLPEKKYVKASAESYKGR